jgi:hypothetical protein
MADQNRHNPPRRLIDGSMPRQPLDSHTTKEEVERTVPAQESPATGHTPLDVLKHYERNPPRNEPNS